MLSRTRVLVLAAVVALVAAGIVVSALNGDDTDDRAESSPPPTPADTAEPEPEREPTVEAAVTAHPAATEAAMDVLADGGTAADAAVATAAVLSVVEPYFSNVIGGETAALYHDGESGEIVSLEAVGPVGSEFDLATYRNRGAAGFGLYQSLVPGTWDGWMLLLGEHGELGLDRLLEPAIALARDGHPATVQTASQVSSALQSGGINAAARPVFAPGGSPVGMGDTIVQEELADSLEQIADTYSAAGDHPGGLEAARDYVYEGELGQRIVAAARDEGASFTAEDLAEFRAELKDPISLDYGQDATVYQNPPTSQGITMLVALNIMNAADLTIDEADTAETAHLTIEALKLALADREVYVGDPDFTDVPVDQLLDPAYGEQQLARIDMEGSAQWPISGGIDEDTTTFQIVDSDGNAVAVTTSTGYQLSAAGDTGIMLGNRMRYMTAEDSASPNFLEAGKKVRYTGNPYMVTDADGLYLLGGSIGSDTQAQIQAQHVVNVLDFGLSAEESIARHRYMSQTHPASTVPHAVPNRVRVENSTPDSLVSGLRQRGQNVFMTSGQSQFGYGSMIRLLDSGREADIGTEPRADNSIGDSRLPDGP